MSKGSTTIAEIDEMPIPDRKILLNTLRQVEDSKRQQIEQMKEAKKYDPLRHKS